MKIDQDAFDAAFTGDEAVRYPKDCQRIINVAHESFKIRMTHNQAEQIWERHSTTMCAGWLIIHDGENGDNDIRAAIEGFVLHRLGMNFPGSDFVSCQRCGHVHARSEECL